MSEGSEERLMDQNQDLDLKRSGQGDEEEEQLQAAKRRKTSEDQDQEQKQNPGQDPNNKKYPKKKVALLMAYFGKGYYGMQVQAGSAPQCQVC